MFKKILLTIKEIVIFLTPIDWNRIIRTIKDIWKYEV